MTVGAVILAASVQSALADAIGQPRVRRLVDIAWAGGALPVVVVAPDHDGDVARAIAETEASWGSPAPSEAGPAGQMVRGAEHAVEAVHDTTAVLLWPARVRPTAVRGPERPGRRPRPRVGRGRRGDRRHDGRRPGSRSLPAGGTGRPDGRLIATLRRLDR